VALLLGGGFLVQAGRDPVQPLLLFVLFGRGQRLVVAFYRPRVGPAIKDQCFPGLLVVGGNTVLGIEMALASGHYPGIIRAALPVELIQLYGFANDFPSVLSKGRERAKKGPQEYPPHT